ncbi:DUF4270 domain-containing protein [Marixanthomonas spongiae]|uniref:DUF4270 domain-containing protein n=1 Tax=Marixanthomonas spongiae TaxID=2174845 RepID=A0A2U0HZJ0_9FLAO|nr:DUF4270 domain-containing protein [Marixanthomonas spongiae]PVW14239.1 DUF4270 domain-containing protein [Marixanthomonas spongiae]
MKIKNLLPQLAALLFLVVALASCEEDIEIIGTEIVGDNTFIEPDQTNSVLAYSRKLLPIQTNGLTTYQLGVTNNPIYGKSTVSLLSQVTLGKVDPKFGDSTKLDSVVLYIPFFNTSESTGEDTISYTLDSVYGEDPINISMYESNLFLRDLDPESGFEDPQNYYSDLEKKFDNNPSLIGDLIFEIEDFKPSDKGIDLVTYNVNGDTITETIAPGLRVKLPLEFFQQKIIDKEGSSELLSNNNFKDYFRGIYFKAESMTDKGTLFLFDPLSANITLHYSFKNDDDEDDEDTLPLGFTGINVSLLQDELPPNIQTAIENPDVENGDENLYLKGGDGIAAVIQLFGKEDELDANLETGPNGVPDELDMLRSQKPLINEANLTFYVNKDKTAALSKEPQRIMIFDATNGRVLIDYVIDPTGTGNPLTHKTYHLGPLEKDASGDGDFYEIKLTNHVSNLINRDSTNVPLGLVVTDNVVTPNFQDLQNTQSPGLKRVPGTSVLTPKGTVLHGNNSPNQDRKLKLELYYTKPE